MARNTKDLKDFKDPKDPRDCAPEAGGEDEKIFGFSGSVEFGFHAGVRRRQKGNTENRR